MRVAGSHTVPVERQRLWDALHDPDLLRRSLPGCSALHGHEAGRYTATVQVGVPCVEGLYNADLVVEEREAPTSLTISGSLVGQPGSGCGRARLDLDADADATTVRYHLDAEVTGAVSRVGRRLLESAVQRTIADHLDAVAAGIDAVHTGLGAGEADRAELGPVGEGRPAPEGDGPVGEARPDEPAGPEPVTVTFAPVRLSGDRLVTILIAAAVAVVAYLVGRRAGR